MAYLVDVERAYINITVHPKLFPYQVVKWDGKQWAMTRIGFGLNIAPRVLKCLIWYILKRAGVQSAIRNSAWKTILGWNSEDEWRNGQNALRTTSKRT